MHTVTFIRIDERIQKAMTGQVEILGQPLAT